MNLKSRLNRLEGRSGATFRVEFLRAYFDEKGVPIDDNDDLERTESILVDGVRICRKPEECLDALEQRACQLKARESTSHHVFSRSDMQLL